MCEEKAQEVDQFMTAYNFSSHEVLSAALYIAGSVSSRTRRRLDLLPTMDESRTLHKFINKESVQISFTLKTQFTSGGYIWLRSLTASVLTLYNVRRGEEGTRLTGKYYQDALDDVWVPQA